MTISLFVYIYVTIQIIFFIFLEQDWLKLEKVKYKEPKMWNSIKDNIKKIFN